MNLVFAPQAWEDYLHWQHTDKAMVRRINALINDIVRSPFDGLGKPEPLKHALAGYGSRRIDGEHRIVYKIAAGKDGDELWIAQLRHHY